MTITGYQTRQIGLTRKQYRALVRCLACHRPLDASAGSTTGELYCRNPECTKYVAEERG